MNDFSTDELRWTEIDDLSKIDDELFLVKVKNRAAAAQKVLEAQLLSDREVRRAHSIRNDLQKRAFILARAALRSALSTTLRKEPSKIVFEADRNGKPWTQGAFFNISHSRDWTIIAVCRNREVGVDIQHMRATTAVKGIAARFFNETEKKRLLLETDEESRREVFFRIWTRKEAYVKAMGTGLFKELAVMEIPTEESIFIDRGDGKKWCLRSFKPQIDYWGSICAENYDRDMTAFEWVVGPDHRQNS